MDMTNGLLPKHWVSIAARFLREQNELVSYTGFGGQFGIPARNVSAHLPERSVDYCRIVNIRTGLPTKYPRELIDDIVLERQAMMKHPDVAIRKEARRKYPIRHNHLEVRQILQGRGFLEYLRRLNRY